MNKIDFSDHTMIKKTFKDGFKDIKKIPQEIKENKKNYGTLTFFFIVLFVLSNQISTLGQEPLFFMLQFFFQTFALASMVTLTVFNYSNSFKDCIVPSLKNTFSFTTLALFIAFLFLMILSFTPIFLITPPEIFSLRPEVIAQIGSNPESIDPELLNILSGIDYNTFIISFFITGLLSIFVLVIGFLTILLNLSFSTLGFLSSLKISLAFNFKNAGYFTSYTLIILPLLFLKSLVSLIALPLVPEISSGLFNLSVFIVFANMIKNTIEDK
jgi:hypothetical protein